MIANSNIIDASDVEKQNYLGLTLAWKITGERTSGALSLVEACGAPGTEPPLHLHELADEFFCVLDGDMTFKVGEEIKRIGSGGFVWIPRTTVHGFVIHSDVAKFLFGFLPAGLEQMFISISLPTGSVDGSSAVSSSPDRAVDAHRERYRTIVAGPPLRELLGKL